MAQTDPNTQVNAKEPAAQHTGARRNEDIALDLLKFVASATNLLRTASPSTGFTAASNPKPEDQVSLLLDLYGRCLTTVQGK